MNLKRLSLALLSLGMLFLSGCFETTDDLTIAENGSGTYKMVMDFSGLFEMIDAIRGMEPADDTPMGLPKERKDTTIHLRDFTDTATALTAGQKALYKNATVNILIDQKKEEAKVHINMPFEKTGDVEQLVKLIRSEEGGSLLSKLMKQNKALGGENANMGVGNMPDLNSFFDLSVAKGRIERKLNQARYDSVMQQYSGQFQAEGGNEMTESIKMNTVLHLPHAAKKVTAANAVTSADKKTITLKGTFADLLKNPQVFAYRIEY